jgi:hypothetical protein
MSPNGDERRMKSSALRREVVDSMARDRMAWTLQRSSRPMRPPVILSLAVGAAILGAALVLNGVVAGAALFAGLPLLLVRRRRRSGPVDRSAVRLALRLAKLGQRTLLVESGAGMRVVRPQDAAEGPQLQFIAAQSNGALILARRR